MHETAVDAFVYENCSLNIHTFSEFCTGAPIISGYGQVGRGLTFLVVVIRAPSFQEILQIQIV